MSSVSIAVADPWTGSFDEREPVRAVGDGHVHARLTLRVAGRPLPGLGFLARTTCTRPRSGSRRAKTPAAAFELCHDQSSCESLSTGLCHDQSSCDSLSTGLCHDQSSCESLSTGLCHDQSS